MSVPAIPEAEFRKRLREKVESMSTRELVDRIYEFAYEEISEEWNNVILDDWEDEWREAHTCCECERTTDLDLVETPVGGMCDACYESVYLAELMDEGAVE